MEKRDLKKEFPNLYKASPKTVEIVTVPKLHFIMVDGTGDPNHSKRFQDAVEALYSVSYTIKFMIKKGALSIDYGVMPLEGLWWTDDMSRFSMEDKAAWKWTLMILQPEFVTSDIFKLAQEQVGKKKSNTLVHELRLESSEEGLCAQILHLGPYDAEPPTIAKLHESIADKGYKFRGKHREIYLNDMRRTSPERLKTIIRQSISK